CRRPPGSKVRCCVRGPEDTLRARLKSRPPYARVALMLVGAFAVAHTPQLLIRPETEDRELGLRVHAAMRRVKTRLQAMQPDAIAIVAGDPREAVFLAGGPGVGGW